MVDGIPTGVNHDHPPAVRSGRWADGTPADAHHGCPCIEGWICDKQ